MFATHTNLHSFEVNFILSYKPDYFLTTPFNRRVAVIPFRFKGFSPTPFAIAPYEC
nr:MAG TPA: hypothetical protein [Caudoviricetes sp.]